MNEIDDGLKNAVYSLSVDEKCEGAKANGVKEPDANVVGDSGDWEVGSAGLLALGYALRNC